MNKSLRLVLAAGFLLAACGGQTAAPAADTSTGTPAAAHQFVASDPTGVNLAAGRPQLVEFFAFW